MIKLLIFDLDGTLINSAQDIFVSVNKLLKLKNRPLQSLETVTSHIGEGLRGLVLDFFPECKDNPELADQFETELRAIYNKEMLKNTHVIEGVLDFLSSWKGKIAIVSNKPEPQTLALVKNLELNKFSWVCILGGTSLPTKKPDPAPLLWTMEKAQVTPNETVMIGDGTPDVLAAKNANVKSVALEFGYTSIAKLRPLKPDAFLSHYSQLHSIIKSFSH